MKRKRRNQKKLKEKVESNNYELFFEDECHFKLTLSIIRAWFLAGSQVEIKSPVDRYKMSVFGAMGENGQLITLENDVFNGETFKLFLERLILNAERGNRPDGKKKKILLVLDNAKYHHAKLLQSWLKEVSCVLELFFLPPYSPDLNPIEMLWKKTRRGVTHNRYFKSLEELRYDLKMFWNQFARKNNELMKLSAFI